jgi:pimeloyl-ACP methyl ester carboxylesterase
VHQITAWLTDAARQGRVARLLAFDIERRGHAVLVAGDLDTAENIAVYVPGMWHRLGTLGTAVRRMSSLLQEMESIGSTGDAVVGFWDYDMPPWFAEATRPEYAEAAVPGLARFLEGLRVTRARAHLTLVAHSYGTIVAAHTLLAHPRLLGRDDDLVILGSPGVPVPRAADLHWPDRTWASGARRDPITDMTRYTGGFDPLAPEFEARVYDAGHGGDDFLFVHGTYFREDLPLRSLALIVVGRGNEVELVQQGPGKASARAAERARRTGALLAGAATLRVLRARARAAERRSAAEKPRPRLYDLDDGP